MEQRIVGIETMNPEPPPIANPHSTVPEHPVAPARRTWKTVARVASYISCGILSLGLGIWISSGMRSSPEFESWPLGWVIVGVCGLVTYSAFVTAWRIWKRGENAPS